MSEQDLEAGTSAEVASDTQSVLDKIKARRDSTDAELTISIPSWDGDLKAKYKVLDRPVIEKMIQRAQARARGNGAGGGDAGVSADCDFLIKACVGVVAIDPEDGETEIPISNGFTMELAGVLKPKFPPGHPQAGEPVPIRDERELVVYLLRWNSVALAAHGQVVARWMQTLKVPIEDPQ